jgi:copper chaperone
MTIQLKVPSMVCSGCVETITKEIKVHEPDADVNIDLDSKIVTVQTQASEESIKQMITAVGHTVD